MSYNGKCGSCANFEDKDGNPFNPRWSYPAKGYCTWYRCYYFPDESCDGRHYRPRGYITTMVCRRLGLDKEHEVYKTIIGFQKDVMEKDKQYEKALETYDIVGPKISKELETEDIDVVQKIYDTFLTPVTELIKENKGDQAIFKYKQMVEILRGHYNISKEKTVKFKQINIGDKLKVLAIKKNI